MTDDKKQQPLKTNDLRKNVPLNEGDLSKRSREIARKGPTPTPPIKKN